MLRAAIIGCGNIAPVHAQAIDALDMVELVACADTDLQRARHMAGEYGIHAYESMEELLEREQVDVVHLCTPHYLHAPMAAFAASRGIHVFSEKPPVIDRAQWTELEKAAGQVRIGVCFQNRYNGAVQKMRALLADGSLGKVCGARAFVTWARDKQYYTDSGWRGRLATEGGGALINQAIHTLDLMVYLMGRPENVSATLSNHHLHGVIEVEDTVEAYMTFGGVPGLFYATTAYSSNAPVYLEIECENAALIMEKDELVLRYPQKAEERFDYRQQISVPKEYWGVAHMACIKDFYEALLSGGDVPIGVNQVRDTVDTMLAIYGR